MRYQKNIKYAVCLTSVLALNSAVYAQEAETEAMFELEEIVVTGTLIKGVDPVGTNVVGLDSSDIMEMGVATATDLLRRVPQSASFNSLPTPTLTSSIPFSPINLRGLGGLSGMTTLVLVDGHRIVPTGFTNWVDANQIPSSLLERVDVMPDGGSSTYGSDAVGGVVNFITKRNAEGGDINVRYGMGKGSYDELDVSGSYGRTWDSGSAILSFSYGERSPLFGKDLGYLIEDRSAEGGEDARTTQCLPANISIDGAPLNAVTRCSVTDEISFYPDEERFSVFGSVRQDLSSNAEFSALVYYTSRDTIDYDSRDIRANASIDNTNPFFSAVGAEAAHTVDFDFSDVLGPNRANTGKYSSYGITPELRIDLGNEWEVTASLNYGESDAEFTNPSLSSAALTAAAAGTTAATALNPYAPSETASDVLDGIFDWAEYTQAKQSLAEARVLVNGDIGFGKIAVGGEYRKEEYAYSAATGPAGTALQTSVDVDRKVYSLFGELLVPIIGDGSGVGPSLDISISGRFDDYSDVGSTTNPKISIDFTPFDGLDFRANWGTSFRAPALADLAVPQGYELFLPFSPLRASDSPFFPDFFKPSFLLVGTTEGIVPETAEIYSVGVDWTPVDALKVSVTYWNTKYEDRMDQNAGFFFGPGYYDDPVNDDFYILNPASAQDVVDQFGEFPSLGFPDLETMFAIFGAPYVVSDQRKDNMGAFKLDGLDFNVNTAHDISIGTLTANFAGTYILNKDKENVQGAGFIDTLTEGDFNSGISAFNASAPFGLQTEKSFFSTTLYHRSGATIGAEEIDSFTTLSLFASHDLKENLTLSLNVDNVFDQAPPERIGQAGEFGGGRAYINAGRVIAASIGYRF